MLRSVLLALLLLGSGWMPLWSQGVEVPTPEAHFGYRPGSDRTLATWEELLGYYEEVARTSPRVVLDTLGTSTRGLPLVMFTITSPGNRARIEELHAIQQRLADPRLIESPAELASLKQAAKTVVLITSHVHSTEVGAGQMPANLLHTLAASDEPEILEILDRVIVLLIPSLNPDGTQLVSEWYRQLLGTRWEGAPPVELYHPYIGHDNNRDWYALTQVETERTVIGAHNRWRPMIVHDIHQMGPFGARIFLPPYVDPYEPNVDPLLIGAINQLGSSMAAELIMQGKEGVVTGAQYDLFTPGRAYSHYHGGVRILSETASAQLASPIHLRPHDLRDQRGFRVLEPSMNFPLPWHGGDWGLPQIVDYQESAALALLKNAARNRVFWVENFYRINQRAVEGWESWPAYWVIRPEVGNALGREAALRILTLGSVEVHRALEAFEAGTHSFPAGSYLIPMRQPSAAWAQTLLERQSYPALREYPGGPLIQPYDVTAHTLPLLMGFEAIAIEEPLRVPISGPIEPITVEYRSPASLRGRGAPRIGLYRGWSESIPAGWTRWLFDQHGIGYGSLSDAELRRGGLNRSYDVILLQDQDAYEIVEGWLPGQQPAEFVGGIGTEGIAALQEFVRRGGRLVAIEAATDLAIRIFDLPVRNRVAHLPARDFSIPGSILRLELEPLLAGAGNREQKTIAWFGESSRAFDLLDPEARVLARYGGGDPRLSGWANGAGFIAGEPAIVELPVGRGSVVLVGFQPNYRGQSVATWEILFELLRP